MIRFKEQNAIENHKTIRIIPYWVIYSLNGRRVFDQSGTRHIARCVAAVFGIACQQLAELRRLAECAERYPDNRASDFAAQEV